MKTKRNKKLIILGLMVCMFALYGVFPLPKGASAVNALINATATISDTDFGETATTTVVYTTATAIPAGGTATAEFHADFTMTGSTIACSGGGTPTRNSQTAICTYAGEVATGTQITITVSGVVNPLTDGDRTIEGRTYDGTTILDRAQMMVYIIDDVLMTAKVNAILEFTITGMTSGSSVNGINCDNDTTSTSTDFGLLDLFATTTVCQQLNVTTNADDGYTVTVEQDQELTSDSNSNINSFNNSPDGTGSTTAETWVTPRNELDQYHTYGHMGLTSDDADLNSLGTYNSFAPTDTDGITQYVGLNNTDPMPIMHHDGPSDGTTQNVGLSHIAYSVEIGSLQEAGDYENTLTYIATPTY